MKSLALGTGADRVQQTTGQYWHMYFIKGLINIYSPRSASLRMIYVKNGTRNECLAEVCALQELFKFTSVPMKIDGSYFTETLSQTPEHGGAARKNINIFIVCWSDHLKQHFFKKVTKTPTANVTTCCLALLWLYHRFSLFHMSLLVHVSVILHCSQQWKLDWWLKACPWGFKSVSVGLCEGQASGG